MVVVFRGDLAATVTPVLEEIEGHFSWFPQTDKPLIQRIRQKFRYQVEGGPERLARTVLHALRRHVSKGEWHDITSSLPKELAHLVMIDGYHLLPAERRERANLQGIELRIIVSLPFQSPDEGRELMFFHNHSPRRSRDESKDSVTPAL